MKYYLRDGRRFIKTENLYGMYANTDGTFTPKRVGNSYGVVVIHNFKEIVIAHLEVKSRIPWNEAIKKYKLPSRLQLLAAFELKDMFDSNDQIFWTNEEDVGYLAWLLRWSNGYIDYCYKFSDLYVREFTTIKL